MDGRMQRASRVGNRDRETSCRRSGGWCTRGGHPPARSARTRPGREKADVACGPGLPGLAWLCLACLTCCCVYRCTRRHTAGTGCYTRQATSDPKNTEGSCTLIEGISGPMGRTGGGRGASASGMRRDGLVGGSAGASICARHFSSSKNPLAGRCSDANSKAGPGQRGLGQARACSQSLGRQPRPASCRLAARRTTSNATERLFVRGHDGMQRLLRWFQPGCRQSMMARFFPPGRPLDIITSGSACLLACGGAAGPDACWL
jgi:hypothetical protein